jgi:hypothetical protein
MATPSNKTNIPARPKCLNILLELFEFFTVSPRNIPNRGNVSQGKTGKAIFLTNLTTAVGFGTMIITNSKTMVEFGTVSFINIISLFVLSIILIPILSQIGLILKYF